MGEQHDLVQTTLTGFLSSLPIRITTTLQLLRLLYFELVDALHFEHAASCSIIHTSQQCLGSNGTPRSRSASTKYVHQQEP